MAPKAATEVRGLVELAQLAPHLLTRRQLYPTACQSINDAPATAATTASLPRPTCCRLHQLLRRPFELPKFHHLQNRSSQKPSALSRIYPIAGTSTRTANISFSLQQPTTPTIFIHRYEQSTAAFPLPSMKVTFKVRQMRSGKPQHHGRPSSPPPPPPSFRFRRPLARRRDGDLTPTASS